MNLNGVIVPLITPLHVDESVDVVGLRRMVQHVIEGGVSGIFILGSSGEGPILPHGSRLQVAQIVLEQVNGRVPVLAGVVETATSRAVATAKDFAAMGVDAIVTMSPFYYGFKTEHILRHFLSLAEAVNVPQVVYNNSPRVGHVLTPEIVIRLLEEGAIVGIKDSEGAMMPFQAFVELKRTYTTFGVALGAEHLAALSVVRGADGLVLGLANIAPQLCVDLFNAAADGNTEQAWSLQRELSQLWRLHLEGPSPLACMKQAATLLGLCQPHISAPLAPPTDQHTKNIQNILTSLHIGA